MTPDEIIDDILRREGGYVNNLNDRGGATKYGITQRTWDAYAASAPDTISLARDVSELTEPMARAFYYKQYIEPFAWIEAEGLRVLIIDCAVNHGAPRAVRWLQSAVGVAPDGVPGPMTRGVVNGRKLDKQPYNEVLKTRIMFYGDIIASDHTQAAFARGWLGRAAQFII